MIAAVPTEALELAWWLPAAVAGLIAISLACPSPLDPPRQMSRFSLQGEMVD